LTSQLHPPRSHRLSYISKGPLSHIVAVDLDLASNLPIGIIGQADPAWFGDAFKAGSNIDAVAENIILIKNDITDMNADAEFYPLILRHGGILLGHAALEFNRAAHRIDGAGKLDQHSVTRSLDDVAAMRRDCGVDKRCSNRL
jgi:hypothetical protein